MYSLETTTAIRDREARAAICGAGIGGLTLAVTLARIGFRPVVFEARKEAAATTEGAFLTLAPNGMNGLKAIGCYEAVKQSGIDTVAIEIQNADGKRLALSDQTDHARVFGAPSVTIGRGCLVAILLAAARAAGVDVRFGERVVGVSSTAGSATVQLSDGTSHEADILVGADGLRSSVREIVFPEYPAPRFTGLIGTGAIVDAPIPDTGGVMRMTFGNHAFFGYLKAPGMPVYWFDSYESPDVEPTRVVDPAAYARKIAALHAADPSPNTEILEHVERIERSYPIYDMPALRSWHTGRVVLIGDAAHAVGPHAGQGASMAIEDALVLGAFLETQDDVTAAFVRYEALRRKRVEHVVKLTAQNSSQKRAKGWLSLLIRDLVLPLLIPMGIRKCRQLFAYRVDQDPGNTHKDSVRHAVRKTFGRHTRKSLNGIGPHDRRAGFQPPVRDRVGRAGRFGR
jgi:2-polyprenyl-6-methoxyphenol hydroxylase-like FAD-dependent oxidoreductase